MPRMKAFQYVCLLSAFFLLCFSTVRAQAMNFYGADVFDTDVPSVYFKVGLYGTRPIVSKVAYDSVSERLGLRRGNIILAVNGADILTVSELNQFSSTVLSVLVIDGFEIKALTVDRLALEKSKAGQGAGSKKTSSRSRQAKEQSPLSPDAPSVVILNRPAEPDVAPVAQTRPQPLQSSLEVVARLNTPAESPNSVKAVAESRGQTIREPGEKPSTAASEKPVATKAASVTVVTPKSDIFTTPIKPAYDRILFENDKGNVSFTHSTHLNSLNREQCMLCHWSATPTLGSIQSRLANHRTAHSLCRGCHQKMESGPTAECYQCHNGGTRN